MRESALLDAIKFALILSVKEKVPEEGMKCPVCKGVFEYLHRIEVKGVATVHMCEMCVEEFREYFESKEEAGVEHLFTNAFGLLLGQKVQLCHIDSDMDSDGYYGVAQYQQDHME